MSTPDSTIDEAWDPDPPRSAPIPLEQLVQDVYASSVPDDQEHILAQLVGKVYESAPGPVQTRLLEQLLKPVGVLALIVIANGIFAKARFRPDAVLRLDDLQAVRTSDVVELAEHVLRTSGEVLYGLSHVLINSASLAGSGAATVLLALLLQRAHPRRRSDKELIEARKLLAADAAARLGAET